MKSTHLSDKEIQQYALDSEAADAGLTRHIHACEQCTEKAEAYRKLFTGLQRQPAAAFDFNLAELVMQQLPVPATAPKTDKENVLIYAFIIAGTAIIGFALYFFRKYLATIFESIAPVFIYLALTAFATLSILLVADIYKKYKKKIHTLDLYQG
jgi:hypothetical protein